MNSNYFKQLLISDTNIQEIVVPDSIIEHTTVKQFYQFLRLIYSSKSIPIDNENFLSILYCSHYFDTKKIETKVIEFLLQFIRSNDFTDEFTMIDLLLLADQYHLQSVLEKCLDALFTRQRGIYIYTYKQSEFECFHMELIFYFFKLIMVYDLILVLYLCDRLL
jgi:hypothetical protein